MTKCLFCEIAAGRIPSEQIYADAEILAFRDINPQAPTHVLVIPRRHLPALASLSDNDSAIMGQLAIRAARIASDLGLDQTGYRWILNHGRDGGQTVSHIHLHILGGRQLGWPPG
jgi:histidine triad (HIT) family protein